MAFAENKQHERYECTAEEYADARQRLSDAMRTKYDDSASHPCYGTHPSLDTRKKQSIAAKERLKDPTNNPMYGKIGINNPNYGSKRSKEFCEKMSKKMVEQMKRIDYSGSKNPRAKRVIRLSDGKLYDCGKDAAAENNLVYSTFKQKCRRGDGFMYYEDYMNKQCLEER